MIAGTNISLQYPDRDGRPKEILQNISFEIPEKRITAFIGRSGAGKTTLLRCAAQLTTGYTGTISYDTKDIKKLSQAQLIKRVGFVFQHFNLFPHMSVFENCLAPYLYNKIGARETGEKRVAELLELVNLGPFAQVMPGSLSGGQKQRVAIARALMLSPEVLLFDEPTSALDPESTAQLGTLFTQLISEGVTIGYASHDMGFISQTLDRVYFLENGLLLESYDAKKEKSAPLASSEKISYFLSHR